MNKRRLKPIADSKRKTGKLIVAPLNSEIESSFEANPEFWSKDIEEVKQGTYETVEEAIEAIADRIVQRISSPTIDDGETKKFVTDLLSSNEEIVATLRSIMQIR